MDFVEKGRIVRKMQSAVEQAIDEAKDAQMVEFPTDNESGFARLVVVVLSDPMYRDSLREFVAMLEERNG
jgi:hypothetical protein